MLCFFHWEKVWRREDSWFFQPHSFLSHPRLPSPSWSSIIAVDLRRDFPLCCVSSSLLPVCDSSDRPLSRFRLSVHWRCLRLQCQAVQWRENHCCTECAHDWICLSVCWHPRVHPGYQWTWTQCSQTDYADSHCHCDSLVADVAGHLSLALAGRSTLQVLNFHDHSPTG